MQKSEIIFWGLVAVSMIYISINFATSPKVNAQVSQQAVVAQPAAQGMGCMAKGGGGMMKKQ